MAGLLPVVGYEVPLPSTNGGCHGMADVVDALLQLQKTCDDVMGNINQRVEKLREKYDDLNERAHDCKERVDSLKGIKKALVVLSAPQLPKDIEQAETTGLHANNLKRRRQALQKKVSQMPLPFKSAIDVSIDGSRSADENKRTAATRPFDPAEKFEFSLLMPPRNNEQLSRAAERGLGRLPRQLDSVTSLLLFNTRENVYREYNDINVFSLMRAERADAMNRRKPDGTFREDFSMRVGGAEYDFNPEMDEGHDLLADLANDLPLEDAAIPIGWDEQMVDPEDTIAPTGQKNRGGGGRRRGGGGGGDDDESVAGASNIRSASPNTNNALPKSMAVSAPLPIAGSVPPPPGTIPGANNAPPMPNMPNMVNPAGMGNRPPLPPGVQGPNTNAPPMPGGGGALVPSMPNIGGGGGGQPPSMPGMPQPPTSMPQQQQSAGAPTPSSSLPKAPGGGGGMHSALMAAIRGTGGASSLQQSSSTAAAAKPAQSTAPAVKNKFAAAMEKRNRAIQGDMSDDDDEPASKPTPAPKPAAKASAAAAAAAAANAAANRLPPPPPPPGQPSSPNNASAPPKSNVPPPPGPPPKPPAPSPYVKSVKLAPDDDW